MSFFSALTVPGLQQHLSFSREDSAILKGYGILFMIFHHVFGLYALPASVDTAWIAPCLTKAAPIFKICVPIFIFITGYAMGWKTNSSSTLGSLVKTGFSHYLKFWKIYFLCLLLATLVSWAFPLPILPSVADMGWKNGLLAVTGLKPCYPDWWYMALFAAASIALYPTCAWITHHICACSIHGRPAGGVPFTSKHDPHSLPAGNRLLLPLFPSLLHSRLHVRLSGFSLLCSFNVPTPGSNPVAGS